MEIKDGDGVEQKSPQKALPYFLTYKIDFTFTTYNLPIL